MLSEKSRKSHKAHTFRVKYLWSIVLRLICFCLLLCLSSLACAEPLTGTEPLESQKEKLSLQSADLGEVEENLWSRRMDEILSFHQRCREKISGCYGVKQAEEEGGVTGIERDLEEDFRCECELGACLKNDLFPVYDLDLSSFSGELSACDDPSRVGEYMASKLLKESTLPELGLFSLIAGLDLTQGVWTLSASEDTLKSIENLTEEERLLTLLTLLDKTVNFPRVSEENYLQDELEKLINDENALEDADKASILNVIVHGLSRVYYLMSDYSAFKQAAALANSLLRGAGKYSIHIRCSSCEKFPGQEFSHFNLCRRLEFPLSSIVSGQKTQLTPVLYASKSAELLSSIECNTALVGADRLGDDILHFALDHTIITALMNDAEESTQAAVQFIELMLMKKSTMAADEATKEGGLDLETRCKITRLVNIFLENQRPIAAWFVEYFTAQNYPEFSYLNRYEERNACPKDGLVEDSLSFGKWYKKNVFKKKASSWRKSWSRLEKSYVKRSRWMPRLFLSFIAATENKDNWAQEFSKSIVADSRQRRDPQFFGWRAYLLLKNGNTPPFDLGLQTRAFQEKDNSSAYLWAISIAPYLDKETRFLIATQLAVAEPANSPLAAALFSYAYLAELSQILKPGDFAKTCAWICELAAPFIGSEAYKLLETLSYKTQMSIGEYRQASETLHRALYENTAYSLEETERLGMESALFASILCSKTTWPHIILERYHEYVLARIQALDSALVADFSSILEEAENCSKFLSKYFIGAYQ